MNKPHHLETAHVVVGVISNQQRQLLIAKRPQGKFMAGFWEFPGGKVHHDEPPLTALKRELWEEVGIHVIEAESLQRFPNPYSRQSMLLDFWRVLSYSGTPEGREGQEILWVLPEDLPRYTFPPANQCILKLLMP